MVVIKKWQCILETCQHNFLRLKGDLKNEECPTKNRQHRWKHVNIYNTLHNIYSIYDSVQLFNTHTQQITPTKMNILRKNSVNLASIYNSKKNIDQTIVNNHSVYSACSIYSNSTVNLTEKFNIIQ